MRAPLGNAVLAGEVLMSYAVARWNLRRLGLPGTLEVLRTPERPSLQRVDRRRLARAVVRTLEPLPVDSRCLMQSLVLTRLLARRGIGSQLVIAVFPGESFGAHSWVESDGVPLLPAEAPGFRRLVTL